MKYLITAVAIASCSPVFATEPDAFISVRQQDVVTLCNRYLGTEVDPKTVGCYIPHDTYTAYIWIDSTTFGKTPEEVFTNLQTKRAAE